MTDANDTTSPMPVFDDACFQNASRNDSQITSRARTRLSIVFLGIVFLLTSFTAGAWLLYQNSVSLADATNDRYQSYLLADELRQSSDDLTRMVRTFVATGDHRFAEQFLSVLAIRNGEQARPRYYNRLYWDFLAAYDGASTDDGDSRSLHDLMVDAGITADELTLLERAQSRSDALAHLESVAMRAMENALEPSDEWYRQDGESNRDMALRLLHGPAYHRAKARIMGPIQEFLIKLDTRTESDVEHYAARSDFWMIGCGGSVIGICVLSLIAVRLQRRITNHETALLAAKNQELGAQQQTLIMSEHKIQQAAEIARVGYWVWDVIQDKAVSCSEECAKIHGTSIEEYLSVASSSDENITWFHADDREYFREIDRKFLVNHKPYDMEYRIITKQGEIRWVRDKAEAEFDENGVHVRTDGVIQDITERHRIEDDLAIALNGAEAANRAKSQFLATMSHELRTPLTSIKGSLGLMVALASDDLSTEGKNLLGIATRNSDAMLTLVNELLDYEKILSGSAAIEISPHDLGALTAKVVRDNKGYAATHGVQFDYSIPSEPMVALIQEHRFEQIMRNLLSNAAKFSGTGDTVGIFLSLDDKQVSVGVRDHGPGIAKEFKAAIFEQFYQIDSSSTRARAGTGLGLPISKALTEGMGGTMDLESELGVGTTFYIRFALVKSDMGHQVKGT